MEEEDEHCYNCAFSTKRFKYGLVCALYDEIVMPIERCVFWRREE